MVSASYREAMLHKNIKVLGFGGAFRVFRGTPLFTIAHFLEPFGLEGATCD